jgi:hypothetical protein
MALPKGGLDKAQGCPQFPGYHFVRGKTYEEYDMVKSCSSTSAADLAAECTSTPYCQALTTAGMLKYRIPPVDLGTGQYVALVRGPSPNTTYRCSEHPGTLCYQETPVEQAVRSALPLRRRQLLQLGAGNYNSWRDTTAGMQCCAGTYVSKDGGFESWLRTGYNMSDDEIQSLVPKAYQERNKNLYQRAKAKGGGRGIHNVLQPKLTGDRMVLKSPLDATVRKAGLTQRVTSEEAVTNLMPETALPVAYDSTSPGDIGDWAAWASSRHCRRVLTLPQSLNTCWNMSTAVCQLPHVRCQLYAVCLRSSHPAISCTAESARSSQQSSVTLAARRRRSSSGGNSSGNNSSVAHGAWRIILHGSLEAHRSAACATHFAKTICAPPFSSVLHAQTQVASSLLALLQTRQHVALVQPLQSLVWRVQQSQHPQSAATRQHLHCQPSTCTSAQVCSVLGDAIFALVFAM